MPFVIYADLSCLIEKTDGCKSNPENSSATKVSENIPSGFSISSSRRIENKHDVTEVKIVLESFLSS